MTPGDRTRQHAAAIRAAEQSGVGHIVYTSAINPRPPSPMWWEHDHWNTEQTLRDSRCGYTIMRDSEWTETHVDLHWRAALATGKLHTIAGQGRCGYVTRVDCSVVAAEVLTSTEFDNQVLNLTGPEALNTDEVGAILSEVTGKPVEVVHNTVEQQQAEFARAGFPERQTRILIALEQGIDQGFLDLATEDFERVTGREPTSVRECLASVFAGQA
jgi:NAD(P)H dehydrogenase (quinone)